MTGLQHWAAKSAAIAKIRHVLTAIYNTALVTYPRQQPGIGSAPPSGIDQMVIDPERASGKRIDRHAQPGRKSHQPGQNGLVGKRLSADGKPRAP